MLGAQKALQPRSGVQMWNPKGPYRGDGPFQERATVVSLRVFGASLGRASET